MVIAPIEGPERTLIDEVAAGVLVDIIVGAGRRLGAAVRTLPACRRDGTDLTIARWFETYRLTQRVPDLPGLSAAEADALALRLRQPDVQAVVRELLAARLAGAAEQEIASVRAIWELTLGGRRAASLFGYYDAEIGSLVDRLKRHHPAALQQIRSETVNARLFSVLNAVDRHLAALIAYPGHRTDAEFIERYKSHVISYHGKLEPPDFERRRRVPIEDLYVTPTIVPVVDPDLRDPPVETDVWALAAQIDRTVLLGEPGGGKTTAANVLMTHHAATGSKIPFLVVLRELATQDRSVAEYIERRLDTHYQCTAPPGLVVRMLLAGHALVIFDSLDELLDPSRRAEVAGIVEQFCLEYPLVPVLVTSRLIGYDQGRLDDSQFTAYRLGGFADVQVAEYAQKWFAQEEGLSDDEARAWAMAFTDESGSARDLRANPLLLSLMCISYRGEGSLPRNRAEVYEQCATLLFRRWDARRQIEADLRAGRLVEPLLRHLAWWMLTLNPADSVVTERQLAGEAARFLRSRGFGQDDEAREAASELVGFCRRRMWVFSDVGVTAAGEPLYSFTHRTFLEYFAAEHLAYGCDTPEQLAHTLVPQAAAHEWDTLGELALQIKDRTSERGGQRIYEVFLAGLDAAPAGRGAQLQFLARCLESVDPTPDIVRALTGEILGHLFSGDLDDPLRYLPLCWLLASCGPHEDVVAAQIDALVAALARCGDHAARMDGLRLAIWAPYGITWFGDSGPRIATTSPLARFWRERRDQNIRNFADVIVGAAHDDAAMRDTALWANFITVGEALAMPGGMAALFRSHPTGIFGGRWGGQLMSGVRNLVHGRTDLFYRDERPPAETATGQFAALGRHLVEHPGLPWITGNVTVWPGFFRMPAQGRGGHAADLDEVTYLGAAATLLVAAECSGDRVLPKEGAEWFGPLRDVHDYVACRWDGDAGGRLAELPVPAGFRHLFLGWAAGRLSFVRSRHDPC